MLRDLGPLPNLRIVEGKWGYEEMRDTTKMILHQSPSLECFINPYLDSELLRQAKSNGVLRNIQTREGITALLPVLEGIPSIRKIHFVHDHLTKSNLPEEPLSPPSHSGEPLNWTHLHSHSNLLITSIFHRLQHLTCLTLSLSANQLKEIITSLHKLRSLKSLTILIVTTSWGPGPLMQPVSSIRPNHGIRHVDISFGAAFSVISSEERGNNEVILSEALSQVAPAIQSMKISADNSILSRWKWAAYGSLVDLSIHPREERVILIQFTKIEINIQFPNSVQKLCILDSPLSSTLCPHQISEPWTWTSTSVVSMNQIA